MKVVNKTTSICPVCKKVIKANLVEKDNKIFMEKSCDEHGPFTDLYYGDAEIYHKFKKYEFIANGIEQPPVKSSGNCPHECGICTKHKSSPLIGVIDVTNRCNLNCPVCFASMGNGKKIIEPSLEELGQMMDKLRDTTPPCPTILLAGGEPTVREDLPEICELAHKKGFSRVMIATNGLRLAQDPNYHAVLGKAKVALIYLQFDGLTAEPYKKLRGRDLLEIKMKVVENARKAGTYPRIALVPTVAKGVNDDQLGDIVKFALDNIDVIKVVDFQPISFFGKTEGTELLKNRITSGDVINKLVSQLDNKIKTDDFFPAVMGSAITEYMKMFQNSKNIPEFGNHPLCNTLAFLIKNNNGFSALTKAFNFDEIHKFLTNSRKRGIKQLKISMFFSLFKVVKPGFLKLAYPMIKILKEAVTKDFGHAMSKFEDENVMVIDIDHFADEHNFDSSKVEKCCVYYSTTDGKIIPFCTYNLLYRDKYELESTE